MRSTLFIAVSPGEIWGALDEDGELAALHLVRPGAPSQIGGIFLGRIVALRSELPAALVDIGFARPGFLDGRDADPRQGLAGLTEGQALIVEVTKEARADKAVGLRALRGERLARIEAAARQEKPPARLDKPEPAIAALLAACLKPAPESIVIDDRVAFAEARIALARQSPDLSSRLTLYTDATPLFEHAGLAAAIETALAPLVELAHGGALHIETTHAATMIDVDSGKASALAANLDAARAVSRQIRLRNLAGPIVIDFVGMKKRQDCDRVLAALKTALGDDREKPEILGWTRLGHLELVRRRRRAPLAEMLYERGEDGAFRKTALTVALEALRAAEREARAQPGRALILALHPDIASVLMDGQGLAAKQGLEARLGQALAIEAQQTRARETFDIRPR